VSSTAGEGSVFRLDLPINPGRPLPGQEMAADE